MKYQFGTILLLCASICVGQYNYGLEVEQQDAKIEGRLNLSTTDGNIYIGRDAGGTTTLDSNIAIGQEALKSLTIGNTNVSIGESAMHFASTASRNVMIGAYAGQASDRLADNVYIGTATAACNFCGSMQSKNIFIGSSAGLIGDSESNIMLGYNAGRLLSDQDSDNLLIIENNNIQGVDRRHLIFGEFDSRKLAVNWDSQSLSGQYPQIPATLSVNGTLYISETAKLKPQSAEPSDCTTIAEYGLMYYDNSVTPHKLKLCTDTGWNDLN